jgi:Asp-tRNA(Asn)/Glu-tRNA(Gln) amidotransferase B subunit
MAAYAAAAVLDAGSGVKQETRHFHENTGTTTAGRSKEEAQDYRYFPEPDLVPVAPPAEWVEQIRAALPEPPSAGESAHGAHADGPGRMRFASRTTQRR